MSPYRTGCRRGNSQANEDGHGQRQVMTGVFLACSPQLAEQKKKAEKIEPKGGSALVTRGAVRSTSDIGAGVCIDPLESRVAVELMRPRGLVGSWAAS